jgi:hypothetical protein
MQHMSTHGPVSVPSLAALGCALGLVVLVCSGGAALLRAGLEVSAAHAATGVTTSTGTVPAAAGTVFGSWDAIVSANVIPLGALAAGLAAIFAGIRAGSGGLIGGGIIGVLAAILTTALPAIVTEGAAGAEVGMVARVPSACLSTLTPMTLALYAAVRSVRTRR